MINTSINLDNIPAELRERAQWVVWRLVMREGKPTKVPIDPRTGRQTSITNPQTWLSFEEAVSAVRKRDLGLGFVFTSDDAFAGVDLDKCRDPTTGVLDQGATEIIAALGSYSEISPSGTGVKIILRGTLPPGRKRKGRIEMYDRERFFTVTGDHLPDTPLTVNERGAALVELHGRTFPAPPPATPPPVVAPASPSIDDATLLRLAHDAKNGEKFARLWRGDTSEYGNDDSAADLALCSQLAFWTGPDPTRIDRLFRRSGLLREKWERRADYRTSTIEKALERQEFYMPPTPSRRSTRRATSTPPVGVDAHAVVTSLADVEPQEVDWLWPGWLARGKVTILGGHPGDGKSTLTAALAAILSRGGRWPDGTPAPLGQTLFALGEDALDDTLRPRLDRHGADPTRIAAIEGVREPDGRERSFNLGTHLAQLRQAIIKHKIDLLIIDPLTSFMPQSDRNGEGDVRDLLTPLGKLADETNVAIIGIMHVGKPTGTTRRPVQQLLGATAFGAVARAVWMIAPVSPEVGEVRRAIAVVKSNLDLIPPPLEWEIDATSKAIVWHGESRHDLAELLSGGGKATPRDLATERVREALRGGPILSTELVQLLEAEGIGESTRRNAYRAAGVETWKTPGVKDGPWVVGPPGSMDVFKYGGSQVHAFSPSTTGGAMPGPDGSDQPALPLDYGDDPAPRREGGEEVEDDGPDAPDAPHLPVVDAPPTCPCPCCASQSWQRGYSGGWICGVCANPAPISVADDADDDWGSLDDVA